MTNAVANSAISQSSQAGNTVPNVASWVLELQQSSQATAAYYRTGHLRAYAHLGEIFEFILRVINDENLYAKFILERERLGVPAAPQGGNVLLPFVRATEGEYMLSDGKPAPYGQVTSIWRPNRSSEKYATVLEFLMAKGIKPEEVVNFIETFEYNGRKKIFGIIAAVQAARGNTRTTSVVSWKPGEREKARVAETLCELPFDPGGSTLHDGFAVYFGCEVNGKIVLKKSTPLSADEIVKFVRSYVVNQETDTKPKPAAKGYRTGNGVSVDLKADAQTATIAA